MTSRNRSQASATDYALERELQSRALMELVVHSVSHKSHDGRDRSRNRIIISFVKAMLATLRSAKREKSKVYLEDLNKLDDSQFNQLIAGLRYVRDCTREGGARKSQSPIELC